MHYDGPSPTLERLERLADGTGSSLQYLIGSKTASLGACGCDLVSTREIRRRLWRAGEAEAPDAGSRTHDYFDQIASVRDD